MTSRIRTVQPGFFKREGLHQLGEPLAEGDLLTIPAALRLLPVSRSMLYALIAEGQIPAVRVRSAGSRRPRLLVHRDDLAAYVARARQAATRAPTRPDADALLAKVRRKARGRRA